MRSPEHDAGLKRLFSHPRMAQRMQEYAAMLRNDLVRGGRLSGPGGGPPPLLPLVAYNGARRWTAPLGLGAETLSLPNSSISTSRVMSYP